MHTGNQGTLIGGTTSPASESEVQPWRNPLLALELRARSLLAELTLDEKIGLLHGDSKFSTAGLPRFGIPARWLSDGPCGVREEVAPHSWNSANRTDDFATALPANIGLAATFDPHLAEQYGRVLGKESVIRGKHIILAPGVNIMRTPLNGRNGEYLGEDPHLAARMAVAFIQGVQSQGVAACIKHFALNNQETERMTIDVQVDEKTLREVYLPAFRAAVVEAGVWCVMAGYNRVRGEYCAENAYLLETILKQEWGFQGLVMSDWNGAHSTVKAAQNGLDLEMGTELEDYRQWFFAQPLKDAVEAGLVSSDRLDEMVVRNLRVMIATGMADPARQRGGELMSA
jgi:beta-glucosidase